MSVRGDVVDAVLGLLGGLTLPAPAPSLVFRRYFVHDKLTEQRRQLVVVSQEEVYEEEWTGGGLALWYPVLVGVVTERGVREELARWEWDVREAVRHALFVTHLAGAATVHNVEYEPSPSFDVASWEDRYDVSAQLFRYRSDELRSG